jgi:hypothetical protein
MQRDGGNINILHVRSLQKTRDTAKHRLESRMDFRHLKSNVTQSMYIHTMWFNIP